MKKPPDKYKCLKVNINSIIKNNDTINTIEDAVIRTNFITTKSYLLLRLWILKKYNSNLEIPAITDDVIRMSFKSLIVKSSGPKSKGNNKLLLEEFESLHSFELENGKNLSAILSYYSITMLTSIENNIKNHFMDYVNRFVNIYFKNKYKEEIKNKDFKKHLFKELNILKNDIKNNKLESDIKYHDWLEKYRYSILPKEYNTSYFYDLKVNPQRYLKYMIFMCLEIEKIDGKSFQFFPLQTSIIPRHIQIDTKSIIELLVDKEKSQYLNELQLYKDILWGKYFNITQNIKRYCFDYAIITDGYSASIRFIHRDLIESEKAKKKKMRECKSLLKGMSKEQKEEKKNQESKNKKNQVKSDKNSKEKETEFKYIDEVPFKYLEGNHIFIDPGKRSLFTMMYDKGDFMSYTNKQHMKNTKRLLYSNYIKKYKDVLNITEVENILSNYNSKSCCINKFTEYISKKIEINNKLYSLYQKKKFRQYKWYSFINTKRSEDNMLNTIENKYGKDSTIIIGDWSIGKQMRNFISTPNLSLKRKLTERFRVLNIDEYRSSCLNYKTEEKCDNLYLPDLKNKLRKKHSILTYQMENKRKGCLNRDKNGCKNIQKIFECYLKDKTRPLKYQRSYKL